MKWRRIAGLGLTAFLISAGWAFLALCIMINYGYWWAVTAASVVWFAMIVLNDKRF